MMPVRAEPSTLMERLPLVRGSYIADAPLADITWFRVGGPAEVLFKPADADDLVAFLANCPSDIPVTIIGVGSNLLVRDGGLRGVVIRLGKAFARIILEDGHKIRAGAGALDVAVARVAHAHDVAGLEFLRGIPGSIGGALRMNGGAYGRETQDVVVEINGVNRQGSRLRLGVEDMGYSYRHSDAPGDLIFLDVVLQGTAGDGAAIQARMDEITQAREDSQPIRSRTGGSTFKNPNGHKAWELIDQAGCRGLEHGPAQVSQQHCNFLINRGGASASDLEALGEEVRARVKADSGVALEWEIRVIGEPASQEGRQ